MAFRYCRRCCLHESRPARDHGEPYCASCDAWLPNGDRASVTAHEHDHHGGAQTVWSLLVCGCPAQEVHDLGHQEGCSQYQPGDGSVVA